MISETATELVRSSDPSMFWISIGILIILFIVTFFKKSIHV